MSERAEYFLSEGWSDSGGGASLITVQTRWIYLLVFDPLVCSDDDDEDVCLHQAAGDQTS